MNTQKPAPDQDELEKSAERLKERVYVTFTALAVLMALSMHADTETPGRAALTLFITVLGVLLASFCADLVAHTVVHQHLPGRVDLRHMIKVGTGALGAVTLPLLLIGAAGLGLFGLPAALKVGQVVLIVTLGALAFIALRRVQLPLVQRVLLVAALAAVGTLAVALELVAHLF